MNEEAVKPINVAKKSIVTIPLSGYAQWYTISHKDGDKTVKLSMSSNASFAVYNAKGTCIYFNTIGGKDRSNYLLEDPLFSPGMPTRSLR